MMRTGAANGVCEGLAMDEAAIRRAEAGDAAAIAAVHVAAWHEAYAGLVPARMLSAFSVARRTRRWHRILTAPDPSRESAVFVAVAPDRTIVGFGSCGRQPAPRPGRGGFAGRVLGALSAGGASAPGHRAAADDPDGAGPAGARDARRGTLGAARQRAGAPVLRGARRGGRRPARRDGRCVHIGERVRRRTCCTRSPMAGPIFRSWHRADGRTVLARLAAALLLALIGTPALACPDGSHRFETFSLPAEALGHAKRMLVWLPPGYDCTDRRYPVLYLNDGHDLFDMEPVRGRPRAGAGGGDREARRLVRQLAPGRAARAGDRGGRAAGDDRRGHRRRRRAAQPRSRAGALGRLGRSPRRAIRRVRRRHRRGGGRSGLSHDRRAALPRHRRRLARRRQCAADRLRLSRNLRHGFRAIAAAARSGDRRLHGRAVARRPCQPARADRSRRRRDRPCRPAVARNVGRHIAAGDPGPDPGRPPHDRLLGGARDPGAQKAVRGAMRGLDVSRRQPRTANPTETAARDRART